MKSTHAPVTRVYNFSHGAANEVTLQGKLRKLLDLKDLYRNLKVAANVP